MKAVPEFIDGEHYWVISRSHPAGILWEIAQYKNDQFSLIGVDWYWYRIQDIVAAIHIPIPPLPKEGET